jgi:hypothetical protein
MASYASKFVFMRDYSLSVGAFDPQIGVLNIGNAIAVRGHPVDTGNAVVVDRACARRLEVARSTPNSFTTYPSKGVMLWHPWEEPLCGEARLSSGDILAPWPQVKRW